MAYLCDSVQTQVAGFGPIGTVMHANPVRNALAAAAQHCVNQYPARPAPYVKPSPLLPMPINPVAAPAPGGLPWVIAPPSAGAAGAGTAQRMAPPGALALGSAQAAVQAGAQCSDVAMDDWELLFHAVTARLRAAALTRPDLASQVELRDESERLRQVVLECVTVLEHLHPALEQELARHR